MLTEEAALAGVQQRRAVALVDKLTAAHKLAATVGDAAWIEFHLPSSAVPYVKKAAAEISVCLAQPDTSKQKQALRRLHGRFHRNVSWRAEIMPIAQTLAWAANEYGEWLRPKKRGSPKRRRGTTMSLERKYVRAAYRAWVILYCKNRQSKKVPSLLEGVEGAQSQTRKHIADAAIWFAQRDGVLLDRRKVNGEIRDLARWPKGHPSCWPDRISGKQPPLTAAELSANFGRN